MVTQATVQSKVNKGFAIAANKVGVQCQWFRPSGPTNPLASGNSHGTLQVLFDTNPSLAQRAPRVRGKPDEWYGAFDNTGVAIGDYLVTPANETYFISTLDPFRPQRVILCNRVVNISKPGAMPLVGLNPGYGTDIKAGETVLVTGYPCAIHKGPRGEIGDAKLPGDTKLPWEEILLPPIPGATLRNDHIVTYNDGTQDFRLILSLVELTSQGYRCTAVLETT